MKCTDKERETCEVDELGCKGCFYNEKTADEMFEDYELIKEYENRDGIGYAAKDDSIIVEFLLKKRGLHVECDECLAGLFLAINKKCEELGWFE